MQILEKTSISFNLEENDFDSLCAVSRSLMSESGGIARLAQAGFVELVYDIVVVGLDGSPDPSQSSVSQRTSSDLPAPYVQLTMNLSAEGMEICSKCPRQNLPGNPYRVTEAYNQRMGHPNLQFPLRDNGRQSADSNHADPCWC